MAKVQFLRGLQADYDALEKDSYVFYYCLDTGKFYLGSIQLNSEDLSSFLDILNNIENQVEDLTTKVNNTIQEIEISGGTEDGTIALWVNGNLAANNIHVTGLGSAAYTDTYNYATAEQGTLAEEAMPRSGGSFTGNVYLYKDPSNTLEAATKQYVDNQISTGISANDAMVFRGTLGTNGTIETVPTGSSVRTGDTYKIITDGEWAGYDCTVGDLLIALVDGPMEEANSNTWAYIPSGNEEVTTLRYSNTETNITSWAQSGDMILAEGATKQVDSFIDNETGSTNLPTSAAVAAYVQQEINNVQSDSSTVTTDSPSQGSPTNPVYLDSGKVTPIFGTVGSYNQPVFLNNGNIVACEETFEDLKNDIQKEVPSITVGTTETGEPGTDAYVYNASTDNNVVLNFIVPRGDQGEKGDKGDTGSQGEKGEKGDKGDTGATGSTGATGTAATISVGTVTTGAAGSSATVTNSGTTSAAVFDFTIPQGAKGDTGATGATGAAGKDGADGSAATIKVGTVTTGDAGTSASVTNSGTTSAAVFDFVIPKGDKGDSTTTTYTGGTGISISGTTINHSNNVSAATAQGDSSKTLTFGGTFTIPTITYDAQGHITAKGTTTMTMPAAPSTDLSNYLPLSGGTMTGTINQQNLTINDGNQTIACVQLFDEGSSNGSEMVIGANGNTFIGSGESYKNLRTDFQNDGVGDGEAYGATSERFYLTSDTNMYFYSNANTISERLGIVYDNSGNLRPLVTGTRSLGSSSYRWNTAYINTVTGDLSGNATTATTATKLGSDTVGSGTKPIYLSSGTPTASTSTVGGSAKPIYLSSGTLTVCSDTVGSTTQPVYLNSGTITAMSGALATTYGGTGNTSGRATYSNVTTTNPTSGTTYYLPFTTGISSGTNYALNGNNGIRYNTLEGTTDAAGYGRIYLGNSTASGTAGNKYGAVMIYGNTGYYWLITGNSSYPSANRTLYMPRSTANGYLVATGAGTGTAVGSSTTPVYISSGGIATACSSSIPTFSVSGSTLVITT